MPTNRVTYRPSNGTEGDMFMSWNCHGCLRDHAFHAENSGTGCEIIARSMVDDAKPAEWTRDPDSGFPGDARCSEWEGPCACPGLFDLREGHETGHTPDMFIDFHERDGAAREGGGVDAHAN